MSGQSRITMNKSYMTICSRQFTRIACMYVRTAVESNIFKLQIPQILLFDGKHAKNTELKWEYMSQ